MCWLLGRNCLPPCSVSHSFCLSRNLHPPVMVTPPSFCNLNYCLSLFRINRLRSLSSLKNWLLAHLSMCIHGLSCLVHIFEFQC
jgi:hypothetical protein